MDDGNRRGLLVDKRAARGLVGDREGAADGWFVLPSRVEPTHLLGHWDSDKPS
jgi:hypothetical protein